MTAYLHNIPNYCVHAVQPLLSRSGSGFGSAEFTIPPKSVFWELLKAFPFSGPITNVRPCESHHRQANRQHTAGQQLTKRRKQLKALNPVSYAQCEPRRKSTVCYHVFRPAIVYTIPTLSHYENQSKGKTIILFWGSKPVFILLLSFFQCFQKICHVLTEVFHIRKRLMIVLHVPRHLSVSHIPVG